MTADLAALRALHNAVKAGTFQRVDWSFGKFPDGLSWDQVYGAYQGSLDAAHALHKAVCNVPDVDIEYRLFGDLCDVTIYDVGPDGSVKGTADTPARAWLLAILAGLIAQQEGE